MAPQHKIAHVCFTSCAIDRQGHPTILPSPTSALVTCPALSALFDNAMPDLSCRLPVPALPPTPPQHPERHRAHAGNRRPCSGRVRSLAAGRVPRGSLPRLRPPTPSSISHRLGSSLRLSRLPSLPRLSASRPSACWQAHPLATQLHHPSTPAARQSSREFLGVSTPALLPISPSRDLEVQLQLLVKVEPEASYHGFLRLKHVVPVSLERLCDRHRR